MVLPSSATCIRFQDSCSKIDAAVKSGLPLSDPTYTNVVVLFIHLDCDDIQVAPRNVQFEQCTRDSLKYATDKYTLVSAPAEGKPRTVLTSKHVLYLDNTLDELPVRPGSEDILNPS